MHSRLTLPVMFCIASMLAYSQVLPTWKELGPSAPTTANGTGGGIGRINCVSISEQHPDFMLVGSARGGVWKSEDAGKTWTDVPVTNERAFGVSDIAIAPSDDNIIYIATGDVETSQTDSFYLASPCFGVMKSTDRGRTWKSLMSIPWSFYDEDAMPRLWVNPKNPSVFHVVSGSRQFLGIWRSSDGGKTAESEMGPFLDIIGNAADTSFMYACTMDRGFGIEISRSIGGERWWTTGDIDYSELADVGRMRLVTSKADTNLVVAVASERGSGRLLKIFVSRDKGEHFVSQLVTKNLLGYTADGSDAIGPGTYALAMSISPTNANMWYIGGANIWRSTDAGTTWSLASHFADAGTKHVPAHQHCIKHHPTRNIIYSCNDGGIWQSTDAGTTWTDLSKGLRILQSYSLAGTSSNGKLILTGGDGAGTLLSTDGKTFKVVHSADARTTAIDPSNSQLMYVGSANGEFRRSKDGGTTWELIATPAQLSDSGAAQVAPITLHPTVSGTLFIGYTKIYKSTDFGSHWQAISDKSTHGVYLQIAVSQSHPDYIYAATRRCMYRTTNGGTTWVSRDTIRGNVINQILVHPTIPTRAWFTTGIHGGAVWEMNGEVFTRIRDGYLSSWDCQALTYVPGTPGRLFVGTSDGLYVKNDDTSYWAPYGIDRPRVRMTDLQYDASSGLMRVATYGRGIWEVPIMVDPGEKVKIKVVEAPIICFGDTIRLQVPESLVYMWMPPRVDVYDDSGVPIKQHHLDYPQRVLTDVDDGGLHWVVLVNAYGNLTVSDTVVTTIKRAPPKPTITRIGTTLFSSEVEAVSYQWFHNGEELQGATTSSLTDVDEPGTYEVITYNVNDCPSKRSESYHLGLLGIAEDGVPEPLHVRPNPTTNDVHMELPMSTDRVLEIFDVRGLIVYSEHIDDGVASCTISLHSLPAAVYYLRLRSNESSSTTMVLRQ